MPAATLTPADLAPFATIEAAKAQAMIDDAMARAVLVAPCIALSTFVHDKAAKAVLRGIVLRWNDAGSGALQSQTAGPFGVQVDTRQRGGYNLQPAEIVTLQNLCGATRGGAYSVSLAGPDPAPVA